MSDLEKEKEKKRWEQIRKTLSNKKKRESQYRKTIIEREQSRKKRLSPIPESKEKNGGKNRKTKRKTKKIGGVSPPPPIYFRNVLSDYRNRLLNNHNRVPMYDFGYFVFNILEELYRSNRNSDYVNAVYDIITDSDNIISLYKENLSVQRRSGQRMTRITAFEFITSIILNRFNQIIDNGNIDDATLINTLIRQERSELTGVEEYKPEIENTIVELQSIDIDSVEITRSQRNRMVRKYRDFINNPIFIGTPPGTPPDTPPN
jgi:hypothetical protein